MAAQRSTSAASRRSPSSSHPSPPPSPTGKTKRSRTKHACDECRRSQKKCDGKALCHRCHLNGTKCVYTPHKSRGQCECGAHKPSEGRDGPVADVYIFPSNTPLPSATHWSNASAIPNIPSRSRETICSSPTQSGSSDEHSDGLRNVDSKLTPSSHPVEYFGSFPDPQHPYAHPQHYNSNSSAINATWQPVPTYPYSTSADMVAYGDPFGNAPFSTTPQTPAFDPASDYYSLGVIDQSHPGYYDIYPFQYPDVDHTAAQLSITPTTTSPSPFSQSSPIPQELYMPPEHLSLAPQLPNKFETEYTLTAANGYVTQHDPQTQPRPHSLHQGQHWSQPPMTTNSPPDQNSLAYGWEQ